MPAVGGFVFDSSGAPIDREIRVYRRDTGAFLGKTRSSGGSAVDPHFDKVSLLLHMDGADGSTTFTDSSSNPKTVTPSGNAKISTAQSKSGGASAYFDGAGSYLVLADSVDWATGAENFTVEFFVYNQNNSGQSFILGQQHSNYYGPFRIENFSGNYNILISSDGHSWAGGTATFAAPAATNVWDHLALVRSGDIYTLYVNGIAKGSRTVGGAIHDSSAAMFIGGSPYTADIDGYIDEVRITKGVARYTANFTPPDAPFPDSLSAETSLAFGEYSFATNYTGEVQVVCLDDDSAPLENDLILRTFPV